MVYTCDSKAAFCAETQGVTSPTLSRRTSSLLSKLPLPLHCCDSAGHHVSKQHLRTCHNSVPVGMFMLSNLLAAHTKRTIYVCCKLFSDGQISFAHPHKGWFSWPPFLLNMLRSSLYLRKTSRCLTKSMIFRQNLPDVLHFLATI